jgi:hypothetical protein
MQYHRSVKRGFDGLISANGFRTYALAILLFTVSTLCVAQRGGAAHAGARARSAPSQYNFPSGSLASRRGIASRGLRRYSPYTSPYTSPYISLPFPFFGDSFNPDDIYSSGYPVASEPPAFVLQAARALSGSGGAGLGNDRETAASRAVSSEPGSSEPMMIELQNGRYVRVHSPAADGEALPLTLAPDNSHFDSTQLAKSTTTHSGRRVEQNGESTPAAAATSARELPPAVLVFRDGHSEDVRDYTIADGVLYARGDFYTDGYWSKKIDLSALNLAQTLQDNDKRNVKFVLPSLPNEVITRF